MIKKTIPYTDFNGVERVEDYYFNISKAEAMEMEMRKSGGMVQMLEKIVQEQNMPAIIDTFKELILLSYGEKSPDGKQFIKSKEAATAFSQTGAYTELFMELVTNEESAISFVNGIVPQAPKTT